MITCILADDEAPAREVLQAMLADYCPEVQLLGVANDVPGVAALIQQHHPDLVLIDVDMPQYSGVQLLDFVPAPGFELVFVTGHEAEMLQVFEASGVAFLLKPLQVTDLVHTIARAVQRRTQPFDSRPLEALRRNLAAGEDGVTVLALPTPAEVRFVEVADIALVRSTGLSSEVCTASGERINVARKFKDLERLLAHPHMLRTSRTSLVNRSYVTSWTPGSSGYLLLRDGTQVEVAWSA